MNADAALLEAKKAQPEQRDLQGWLFLAVPIGVILLYGLVILGIELRVAHHHQRVFTATRNLSVNHVLRYYDVVVDPGDVYTLGPPLVSEGDFVGRYVKHPIKRGDAVKYYEDTAPVPTFGGRPKVAVFWLKPDEERFVDAMSLEAGEHVDVCVEVKRPWCVTYVEVAALVCTGSNGTGCSLALWLPKQERGALLAAIADNAVDTSHSAHPVVDILRLY